MLISRPHSEVGARPISALQIEYADGQVVERHHHTRGQLIYAVAGVMELATDDGLWLLPPQRAVWMPASIDHKMRARGPVSLRTIYIRSHACPAHFPPQPQTVQVSSLLRELILRAIDMPRDYDEEGHDGRILALLLEEIQWAPERALHLPTGRDRRIARVCQAVLANPGDNRTLEEWGNIVGASPRTLARLYQFELGVPFATWRQQARILAALPRLAAGEPVTSVAVDLGYETPGAFAAMFRRLMGTTPSKYFRQSR